MYFDPTKSLTSVKLEGTIISSRKKILRILVKKLLYVHMSNFFVLKQFEQSPSKSDTL